MKCQICKYYQIDGNDLSKGSCRLKPPSVFLMMGNGGQTAQITQFPIVMKDWWCGEFESKINVDS